MADRGALQFGRSIELLIGNTSGNQGLSIKELRVQFSLTKYLDNKDKGNECNIQIFNLSEESVKYIQSENIGVILRVGWNDDTKTLFTGSVMEISSSKDNGIDKVTTLRCTPDASIYYNSKVQKTFPAGATVKGVIDYIVANSGGKLSKADYNSVNMNEEFTYGYSVDGTIKQVMDELCRDANINYRVDNGRLYVNDTDAYHTPNPQSRAYIFRPDSGLLGEPSYASPDGKKIKNAKDKFSGVKFTALLNPLVIPGNPVTLSDTSIEGTFRVNSVSYRGDNRGTAWDMTCWCDKVN